MFVRYKEWPCTAVFETYAADGSVCIQLIHAKEFDPVATATVYVDIAPSQGCVWIKDYAESAGMLEALEAAGIVRRTGRVIHQGHVTIPEARLLLDADGNLL